MAIYLFKGKSKLERSHIGQIIMSTTLNTQAKVIAQYGGTTWTKIEGRFLLGASSGYPVNSTGGEKEHTLSENEMPNHSHGQVVGAYSPGGYNPGARIDYKSDGACAAYPQDLNTEATGGGQPHNNMPPYKAVYIWERTA